MVISFDIGLNEQDCNGFALRAELSKVSGYAESEHQITQFTHAGTKRNLSRNCSSSPRSTASGGGSQGLFYDNAQRRDFPPSGVAASARPGFFALGRNFAAYPTHLEKACRLLSLDVGKRNKAVTWGSRKLAVAENRGSRPMPAVAGQQLTQTVSTRRRRGQPPSIAVICWTFLRRAHSACLPPTRAHSACLRNASKDRRRLD